MSKKLPFFQVSDEHFDLRREKKGKSFKYYWCKNGMECSNLKTLDYIKGLVIPPNWKDVEICSDNKGHILAFGYDDKNRKQYIYNPLWQEHKNQEKFDELIEFAAYLPKIRRRLNRDLEKTDWVKDKVLALVVKTLDETYIRIGNVFYQRENSTHGLTTLRRKHLEIKGNKLQFQFKGKSNQFRSVSLENKKLVKMIKKAAELPGYEIFRYKENGVFKNVTSSDVNDYLFRITSKDYFTAKDFRTWGGSTMAVEYYPEAVEKCKKNKRLKVDTTLVKLVAKELGNTVSICRDYYIHPIIFEKIEAGKGDELLYRNHRKGKYSLSAAEKKLLQLIS